MSHDQTRRTLLGAFAAAPFAIASAAPNPVRWVRRKAAYTASTAPDPISRAILARGLSRIDQGGGEFAHAIHRNAPQIIEQNLARMSSPRMTRWLSTMSSLELQMLAQVYTTAAMDAGGSTRALDVLAHRLSGAQLGRVSQYFGFAPVYASVLRTAPGKATAFQEASSPAYWGPTYASGSFLAVESVRIDRASKGLGAPTAGASPSRFLDMTPFEIYLDFRTAPFAGLSVPASLFSSALVVWGSAQTAFSIGYGLGYGLSQVINYFAPTFYERAGDAIFDFMENFRAPPPEDEGRLQEQLGTSASLFDIDDSVATAFAETGGDFGVANAWAVHTDWGGTGGGGGGGGGAGGGGWDWDAQ